MPDRTVQAITRGDGYTNDVEIPFGSLGEQNADEVEITGGTLAGVTVDSSDLRLYPRAGSISGAGTDSATATLIGLGATVVSTVGASTGVRLPAPAAGNLVFVANRGANALLVYPPTGGTINALSMDAGFSVAAGKSALFYAASATALHTLLSA